MLFLATIDTLCFGVAMGTMNIIIIYAQFVFGWSGFESSAFLSATNICRVGALVVILPAVTRFVRGRAGSQPASHEGADKLDLYLIRFSIVFDLFGYIGYASAKTGAVMVISGMIASFGGIASPTLQATLTKHVPTDRTGQLLGATGLLHALARVVAPTIFNLIYAKTYTSHQIINLPILNPNIAIEGSLSIKPVQLSLMVFAECLLGLLLDRIFDNVDFASAVHVIHLTYDRPHLTHIFPNHDPTTLRA
ncbi:putative tetracycline-efflux transporter [Phaeomoniella chlamydospora]|uniref:Putative tetracycline-efflux transporter n=1 Tax=Phaeomoniella chlamydospora TaxID=158046 RepID=A0A0G2H186_PHACM|nr:putative tetracycline-efflux transporter [Phaeomoniella chlamydospora]